MAHPRMSRQEWQASYREAWSLYYTPTHMKTLLRRAAATGVPLGSLVRLLTRFALTDPLENVHPLQGGIFRLKYPSERRPDLPRERLWVFWPRFMWHTLRTHAISVHTLMRLLLWKRAITRDPDARTYTDLALTPVRDDDVRLDLLTKTAGARAAVAHINKVNELIGATQPHSRR